MLSIIVAIAQNMAIGNNNRLLCHLSDDLKRFKSLTSGHTVIMGRNTFDSLPRKPLPNRRNVVITRNPAFSYPAVETVGSVGQSLALSSSDSEAFVMGGASVYAQFLPYVDKLYVTWIYQAFEADTFFPTIDPDVFVQTSLTEPMTDPSNGIRFAYAEYLRRSLTDNSQKTITL